MLASQTPSFRMIQTTSQLPGTVQIRCKILCMHGSSDLIQFIFSLNPLITFSTKHDIDFGNPEYNAPNDWYSFFAFAFVVEKDTNNSIPTIYFNLDNSGAGDFSIGSVSYGTPSSNQFTYNGEGGSTTVEVGSYTIYPVIERSRRAKALTFSMFAINWMDDLVLDNHNVNCIQPGG